MQGANRDQPEDLGKYDQKTFAFSETIWRHSPMGLVNQDGVNNKIKPDLSIGFHCHQIVTSRKQFCNDEVDFKKAWYVGFSKHWPGKILSFAQLTDPRVACRHFEPV